MDGMEFEKHIRKKLEAFDRLPSKDIWQMIQTDLPDTKPNLWAIYGQWLMAAAVGLFLLISFVISDRNERKDTWATGKALFMINCNGCHKATGKDLGALAEVWKKYPEDFLLEFTKDSEQFLKSQNPIVVSLQRNFDKTDFHQHADLTVQELTAIYTYLGKP